MTAAAVGTGHRDAAGALVTLIEGAYADTLLRRQRQQRQ
jgi:hypothetical protein